MEPRETNPAKAVLRARCLPSTRARPRPSVPARDQPVRSPPITHARARIRRCGSALRTLESRNAAPGLPVIKHETRAAHHSRVTRINRPASFMGPATPTESAARAGEASPLFVIAHLATARTARMQGGRRPRARPSTSMDTQRPTVYDRTPTFTYTAIIT